MALTVTDNPAKSRYELRNDGHLLGLHRVRRARRRGARVPAHVITEPKRGAGYGATLVQGALDDGASEGAHDRGAMPVRRRFIDEHPDYQDLLA